MSEPLYAKVDKSRKHGDEMGAPPSPNHVMMGQDPGPDGVDSWVQQGLNKGPDLVAKTCVVFHGI